MSDYTIMDDIYSDLPDIKENDANYDLVPPATYTTKVERAKCEFSDRRGCDQFSIGLVIDGGPQDGRWLWVNVDLKPEKKCMSMFKGLIGRFGVDAKPSEIGGRLGEFLDRFCEVKVKHNEYNGKTYANTYINRVVERDGSPEKDEMPF